MIHIRHSVVIPHLVISHVITIRRGETILSAFATKNYKNEPISFAIYVSPSQLKNSRTAHLILMRSDNGGGFINCVYKYFIWQKNLTCVHARG
jgi:hypothetical protein